MTVRQNLGEGWKVKVANLRYQGHRFYTLMGLRDDRKTGQPGLLAAGPRHRLPNFSASCWSFNWRWAASSSALR
jgi:hypothetical protein